MKKLLLLLVLIGLGADGPKKIVRSPKDMATGPVNRPQVVLPSRPAMTGLVPTVRLSLVINTNLPPNRDHPQLPHTGMTIYWTNPLVRTTQLGPHTFALLWGTNLTDTGTMTNTLGIYPADGMPHSREVYFRTNLPQVGFMMQGY